MRAMKPKATSSPSLFLQEWKQTKNTIHLHCLNWEIYLTLRFSSQTNPFTSATQPHTTGVYDTTYQFKQRNDNFYLVGLEYNSTTISTKKGEEVWSVVSVNLLTSEATYWAQAFDVDKPSENSALSLANKRLDQVLRPTKGKKRTVKLKINGHWDLAHFDLYSFQPDFLCHYFDDNLKFHNNCN
jgi:hypothetical protein